MVSLNEVKSFLVKTYDLLNGCVNPGKKSERIFFMTNKECREQYSDICDDLKNITNVGEITLATALDYTDGSSEVLVLEDNINTILESVEDWWQTYMIKVIAHELSHIEQIINYPAYNNNIEYREFIENCANANAHRFIFNYARWLANNLQCPIRLDKLNDELINQAIYTSIYLEKLSFAHNTLYWPPIY